VAVENGEFYLILWNTNAENKMRLLLGKKALKMLDKQPAIFLTEGH
jgi:hypothetical protein